MCARVELSLICSVLPTFLTAHFPLATFFDFDVDRVLANSGIGYEIAWRRALLVIIGMTASFIVM